MDPNAIAQLPFVAFLLVVGGTVFGMLARGVLRWNREVIVEQAIAAKSEKSESEWKAIATSLTATVSQNAEQIKALTDQNRTLLELLQQRRAS